MFDWCKTRNADGEWIDVKENERVKVAADEPVKTRVQIRNLAEAAKVTLSMEAVGRTPFGEKFTFKLVPMEK